MHKINEVYNNKAIYATILTRQISEYKNKVNESEQWDTLLVLVILGHLLFLDCTCIIFFLEILHISKKKKKYVEPGFFCIVIMNYIREVKEKQEKSK